MEKCKHCSEPIHLHDRQVGGVHMICEHEYYYAKTESMMKVRPFHTGGAWAVITIAESEDQEAFPDSEYEKMPVKMSKGELELMPEHGGW